MEYLHVEYFNYPREHKAEQTADGIKTPENQENDEEQTSIFKEIMSWVIPFAIALVAALLIKNFLIINADVPTGSMENTILPGDRFIGNRLAYVFGDESEIYVKRVIGLPGDTIAIEDGKIYINGSTEPLQEDYLKEEWTVATGPYTFEVPEGSYFMMGDNRNDSWDARYWSNTYVTKDKILGKALFTYWPFAHFGKLE